MLIDYHVHALSHGEYQPVREWYEEFLLRARAIGITEIGFSEHDEYWELINPAAIRSIQTAFPEVKIKIGLEVEYKHINKPELQQFLSRGGLDYIIGSVHFLGDWNFDHPDYKERFAWYQVDELYQHYFNELASMINSRFFDVVGHLDLIKIWGYRPQKPTVQLGSWLLGMIRQAGMAVEINSGGLRKPVAEIYPEPAWLDLMYAANIPLTMGSDAHHPDQVGYELDFCRRLAKKAGYRKLAVFTGRQLQLIHNN